MTVLLRAGKPISLTLLSQLKSLTSTLEVSVDLNVPLKLNVSRKFLRQLDSPKFKDLLQIQIRVKTENFKTNTLNFTL